MVQLALFAIPRGYTEEGEANSAVVAPRVDSDDSSLGDDPPYLVTAEQIRKCEDILDEFVDLTKKRAWVQRFAPIPIPNVFSVGSNIRHGQGVTNRFGYDLSEASVRVLFEYPRFLS
jgi:hypothetical protein